MFSQAFVGISRRSGVRARQSSVWRSRSSVVGLAFALVSRRSGVRARRRGNLRAVSALRAGWWYAPIAAGLVVVDKHYQHI